MSLVLNIEIENYDSESWKNVSCSIDNKLIREFYSYPIDTDNATILYEIEQDLLSKGYSF